MTLQQDTTDASMALPVGVVKGAAGGKRVPWEIRSGSGTKPYCVHNQQTGRKVACHATRSDAEKQMRALYALATKGLVQTTTSQTDINADTAHTGKSGVKALGKSGEEQYDDEDYRRDQLQNKAYVTQPYAPTPLAPSTEVQAPHGNTAPVSDTKSTTTQAAYPEMPGLGGPAHDQWRRDIASGRTLPRRGGTMTSPAVAAESREFSTDVRQKYAKSGVALPDGSYPIPDKDALDRAIRSFGRAPNKAATKRHIIKRARALGATDMLPDDWKSATQESLFQALAPVLILEGTVPKPVILQEASAASGGKMRVRVPFYIGESVSRAPGFQDKIYFPTGLLPSVVQEAQTQIREAKQPLTVYARHAHATSGDHLPVGAVADVEHEGRIGYAVLEIAPTEGERGGKNIQTLIQAGHLNAVSLRSGPGRFELERKKVNGEPMLQAARLAIDGIDFAPDSPAMKTYGVEVLAAEARVESTTSRPKRRTQPNVSDVELTLDTLRNEWPELVTELEAPLRKELNKITLERDSLQRERDERNREAKLQEIASQFPEPAKALPVLQELCSDCTTDAQVAEKAFPVLLEALARSRTDGHQRPVERPAREVLLEMFRPGGAGRPMIQEADVGKEIDPSVVGGDFAEV